MASTVKEQTISPKPVPEVKSTVPQPVSETEELATKTFKEIPLETFVNMPIKDQQAYYVSLKNTFDKNKKTIEEYKKFKIMQSNGEITEQWQKQKYHELLQQKPIVESDNNKLSYLMPLYALKICETTPPNEMPYMGDESGVDMLHFENIYHSVESLVKEVIRLKDKAESTLTDKEKVDAIVYAKIAPYIHEFQVTYNRLKAEEEYRREVEHKKMWNYMKKSFRVH